ncbi:MAG: glycyl-radical enzyme activating protein [Oscillospiraceae bacterium]|jgi:pyruvate formate lyase activating enzyme|nr:glycyl-radical enzyme activating protein [Oscillospiraceae bacterium]
MIYGNIYDIQKFSVHDGPGIRTDVYLKGCPLTCVWCHSPESQTFGPDLAYMEIKCIGTDICGECVKVCPNGAVTVGEPTVNLKGDPITYPVIDRGECSLCLKCADACPSKGLFNTLRRVSVEDCMRPIRQDKRYYDKSGGGVTISGGEPMSQFEFCEALAMACKEEGFSVALDTTGFAPTEHYLKILPYVDLFLFDLKHMDSERSKKLTGVPNELIKKNAKELADAGARFQIRFPIIPNLNDSEDNIRATAEFCLAIKHAIDVVQLLPFHKMGQSKYERLGKKYRMNASPPNAEFMERQRRIFADCGLPAQVG